MARLVLWVAYDISSDKKRRAVERCLAQFGDRLQYSLFEIVLNEQQWPLLRQQLQSQIDTETDALNYYPICPWCRDRTMTQGTAELPSTAGFVCIC